MLTEQIEKQRQQASDAKIQNAKLASQVFFFTTCNLPTVSYC